MVKVTSVKELSKNTAVEHRIFVLCKEKCNHDICKQCFSPFDQCSVAKIMKPHKCLSHSATAEKMAYCKCARYIISTFKK